MEGNHSTRERLMRAFEELITGKAADKITVTAVVEKSGVTRKTFYYHFKDIYDLIEAYMEQRLDELVMRCQNCAGPEEALTLFYTYIMRNQKYTKVLVDSPRYRFLVRTMGEKIYQYFYRAMEKERLFREMPAAEAEMLTSIVTFSILGIGMEHNFQSEEEIRETVGLLLRVMEKYGMWGSLSEEMKRNWRRTAEEYRARGVQPEE